jgi:soluble lytic murein transglycosylase-like protein
MRAMQVVGFAPARARGRLRVGAVVAPLALIGALASSVCGPVAAASGANGMGRAGSLERQLRSTLAHLDGTRARLAALSARTATALAALDGVSRALALASGRAVAAERAAAAATAAVVRIHAELDRLEAVATRRRLAVRAVLLGDEVASADPLGALAPLLGGGSFSQAAAVQSEIALVGSANARALERAGQAVLAARREARRLAAAATQARLGALRAARARAQVAAERAREAALVTTLTRDRAATAAAVAALEAHAAGLRQALDALLAAARTGKVGRGTLLALVAAVAQAFHVDPALVWAVVMVESGGNPTATSSTGAQGLMQLEPATAAALGVRDAYNPRANLAGGTAYLAGLVRRYGGNLALALAAYTLGPAAVPVGGPVPVAARAYVDSVLAYRRAGEVRFAKTAGGGGRG